MQWRKYRFYCVRNFYTAPLALLQPQKILYGFFFTYKLALEYFQTVRLPAHHLEQPKVAKPLGDVWSETAFSLLFPDSYLAYLIYIQLKSGPSLPATLLNSVSHNYHQLSTQRAKALSFASLTFSIIISPIIKMAMYKQIVSKSSIFFQLTTTSLLTLFNAIISF